MRVSTLIGIGFGLLLSWQVVHAQSFTILNPLPGDDFSAGYDVSDNGVVAGFSNLYGNWQPRGVVWSSSVPTPIGSFGGGRSFANAISASGTRTVGWALDANAVPQSFLWTGSLSLIPSLGAGWGEARGISADGTVVVGISGTEGTDTEPGVVSAYRWTASEGAVSLHPFGYGASAANGVSSDGTLVGGFVNDDENLNDNQAYLWDTGTGVEQNLHPSGYTMSEASDATRNDQGALVVAGWGNNGSDDDPLVWVNGAMTVLPHNPTFGRALSISADGRLVVGYEWWFGAVMWRRESDGSWTQVNLNSEYASLLSGWILYEAHAISPNGRYITGYAYNPALSRYSAYLLDRGTSGVEGDVNGDGCVDDADLLAVLFAFGGSGGGAEDVNADGIVDDADLLIVLFNFGTGC